MQHAGRQWRERACASAEDGSMRARRSVTLVALCQGLATVVCMALCVACDLTPSSSRIEALRSARAKPGRDALGGGSAADGRSTRASSDFAASKPWLPSAEREAFARDLAIAAELESTLALLPQVRKARVHLAPVSREDGLGRALTAERRTASVLVLAQASKGACRSRGEELRALVAHAVPLLAAEDVHLSCVPASAGRNQRRNDMEAGMEGAASSLEGVGPFVVARGDASLLRWTLGSLLLLQLGLAYCLFALWRFRWRLR